jgi:integrase
MSLYKQKGSSRWWYKFQFKGREVRESSGTGDRETAEQVEAKRKRELFEQDRLGVKPTKLWDDAVISYLETLPEGRNKEQTKAELRWSLQFLRGKPLPSIDLEALQALQRAKSASIAKRTGKPAAPGTINRVLGVIMSVLHHAASAEWIAAVPKLPKVPDRKKVIRFITREQARALLLELRLHQRAMVIFALETGWRRSNVTQLRWDQVDLERRIAWVNPDQAKEGEAIPAPLSDVTVALLRQFVGNGSPYVFLYRGKPVKQTATRAWRAALKRAGIENFRWHDLRHTWASWHRQDGTPTAVLKELGGWKDDRMPGRYAHLGADHLAEYVQRRKGLGIEVGIALKKKKPESRVSD